MRGRVADARVPAIPKEPVMKARSERLTDSIEGCLVVLVPFFTILFGAAMIHVAVKFGFTAVGEPIVAAAAPSRD
jgi:hypothetical protein